MVTRLAKLVGLGLLFAISASGAFVQATVVFVPEPSEIIRKATFVASGRFIERKGDVYFIVGEVMKSDAKALNEYRVGEIIIGELLSPQVLSRSANGQEIIFLGDFDDKGALKAIFGFSSIWPSATSGERLQHKTLDECKVLVRETIKRQKHE